MNFDSKRVFTIVKVVVALLVLAVVVWLAIKGLDFIHLIGEQN